MSVTYHILNKTRSKKAMLNGQLVTVAAFAYFSKYGDIEYYRDRQEWNKLAKEFMRQLNAKERNAQRLVLNGWRPQYMFFFYSGKKDFLGSVYRYSGEEIAFVDSDTDRLEWVGYLKKEKGRFWIDTKKVVETYPE